MLGKSLRNFVKRYPFLKLITKPFTYLYLVIANIINDGLSTVAGFLTYSTLLAIVPTLLVFFSILSLMPAFDSLRSTLEGLIFDIISPNSQDTLSEVFTNVIAKTNNLGVPSVISLFVIAFLLVRTIDITINKNIWGIRNKRKLLPSFTLYWTVISFGPMLLASLFFAKSYLSSISILDSQIITSTVNLVLDYLQAFILWGILFFAYVVFPQTKVKWWAGIVSATIITLLCIFAKSIFLYYITAFPSYYIIYGAIAAFPITVLWFYIIWYIILIGAALTRIFTMNNLKSLWAEKLIRDREDLDPYDNVVITRKLYQEQMFQKHVTDEVSEGISKEYPLTSIPNNIYHGQNTFQNLNINSINEINTIKHDEPNHILKSK